MFPSVLGSACANSRVGPSCHPGANTRRNLVKIGFLAYANRGARRAADGGDASIDGDLTIKGVTRLITLQVRFVGAGINPRPPNKATVGFAATAAIKRSDFNISFGVPIISDRIDLVINAAFEAE